MRIRVSFLGIAVAVLFVGFFTINESFLSFTVAGDVDAAFERAEWKLECREELGPIWNGVTVGFKFIPRSDAVYVGFYRADRSMTIGRRAYEAEGWEFKTLPTQIGWDSHNYVEMSFDRNNILHVSGNMHASRLNYFRALKPNDISTLERVDRMVGENESSTTYPRFMNARDGRLLFTYRDGHSGNGSQLWNVYDEETQRWSRLLERPLFDGKGQMNAYFTGPTLGPDGFFHIAWVWRDTPDCATNHDFSYARSRDLIHWEKSNGEEQVLPITVDNSEIVAPIPSGGGLLNTLIRLSFDQNNRPLLAYSRYDEFGNLQIWASRCEETGWRHMQITDWELPWRFSGGGSIQQELTFGAISIFSSTTLAITWNRIAENRRGTVYLDASTLERIEAPKISESSRPKQPEYGDEVVAELYRNESDDPRLVTRSATIMANGERWVFRWEAPKANRDRPLPDGAPVPTPLRVFKFKRQGD